jgi:hypothetical protein
MKNEETCSTGQDESRLIDGVGTSGLGLPKDGALLCRI